MDTLVRFMFDNYQVRGQIVRLDRSWREVASRHQQHDGRDLAPTVRHRLGELSAAGALLAASIRFDGGLVMQIQGDGPVALFVVEHESNDTWRATVKLRPQAQVPHDASLADMVNQRGSGRFAVTLVPDRPPQEGEPPAGAVMAGPYQGIVPFEGDTVAEV